MPAPGTEGTSNFALLRQLRRDGIPADSIRQGYGVFFQPIPEGDPRLAPTPLAAEGSPASISIMGGSIWGPSIVKHPHPAPKARR